MATNTTNPKPPALTWEERRHYRDRLREARYAALADAEGFSQICFAVEALGLRLLGRRAALGKYLPAIRPLAEASLTLFDLAEGCPSLFTSFEALYDGLTIARNDAMHTGAYARHATVQAMELCIGLEEALMADKLNARRMVADYMVKSPVTIESWQPVARARQLMLMYSFTYLPVYIDDRWKLVSEAALAKYLHKRPGTGTRLATTIEAASSSGLQLLPIIPVHESDNVEELLHKLDPIKDCSLWLVTDNANHLCGVLSPFELM